MRGFGILSVVFTYLSVVTGALLWQRMSYGTGAVVPPGTRDAALGFSNDTVVMFGGRRMRNGVQEVLSDTWIFDIINSSWQRLNVTSGPPARFSSTFGTSKGYFYIATGEGPSGKYYNDIWRWSFTTQIWEELSIQGTSNNNNKFRPMSRHGASGGIFPESSEFFVAHGFSKTSYNDVHSYNTESNDWEQDFDNSNPYNPAYPHARYLHAGTMIAHKEMILFGGCLTGRGAGGPCPSSDLWRFDGRAKEWSSLDGSCVYPRTRASMALLPVTNRQRRVVIYGGEEEGRQVIMTVMFEADELAVINPDRDDCSVKKTQGDIPQKRASAAMTSSEEGIFMFGGYSISSGQLLNDLYLLQGDASSADSAPMRSIQTTPPHFVNFIMIHGVLMVVSYGVLLLWGMACARYSCNDSGIAHVIMQALGITSGVAGFILGLLSTEARHFSFVHGIVGLTVMVLTVNQVLLVLIRPRMPNNLWTYLHRLFGRSALILGLINICLGVFLALSHRIIWITWFVYLGVVVVIFVIGETIRAKRRSDDVFDELDEERVSDKEKASEKERASEKDTPL